MHARRPLAAAFALALVLAACGGGDDDADATTTTAAEETTASSEPDETTTDSTTTTEAELDDPQAIAEAVNLTARDFPSGWTAEPDDGSDDDVEVTECFVDSDLAGNTLAEADSDSFSQETDDAVLQVGSTGIVTGGSGIASTVLGEATRAAFAECVLGQFEASLAGEGLTITSSNLAATPGVPTDAEQVIALNGALTFEDPNGVAYDVELSMWLHRQGPVIAGVSVLGFGDADFAGWVDTANDIVSERLVEVAG